MSEPDIMKQMGFSREEGPLAAELRKQMEAKDIPHG